MGRDRILSDIIKLIVTRQKYLRLMNFGLLRFGIVSRRLVPLRRLSTAANKKTLHVTFVTPESEEITCNAAEGDNLLDIAHENDVELEGSEVEFRSANNCRSM